MRHIPRVRLTPIRRIILDALTRLASHPTANEIYELVREQRPRIGLSSVYRNLVFMADNGVIRKIKVGGTSNRFDAIIYPHYHICCSTCGKVDNIDIPVQLHINVAVMASSCCGYNVLGHHIEFFGICQNCQHQCVNLAENSTSWPRSIWDNIGV